MTEAEFTFRPFQEADLPFIIDSWGSSYYKGSMAHRVLNPGDFHSFHRPLRIRFLSKATTTILVCVDAEDPWLILGWIALEESIPQVLLIHYIYVKSAFKGLGIAKKLVQRVYNNNKKIVYSHITERAAKIISKSWSEFGDSAYIPNLI